MVKAEMNKPQDRKSPKTAADIPPIPSSRDGLVEYIIENVKGLRESEIYEIIFFGDHTEFLECSYLACSALGEYIVSMVDMVVEDPSKHDDLKPVLDIAFEIIEKLSSSDDDGLVADVTSGTFDEIVNCKNDKTFAAILNRFGPKSRKLYDYWTPRLFPRQPIDDPGIKL